MSTIDLKRFHATFFAESFDGLSSMEVDLLQLEQGNRDPEILNAIFRVVHSIKGAGGSLGFEAIAEFSHQLETLLDRIRKGQFEPAEDTINLLLASVDCLRGMLTAAQTETKPDMQQVKALQAQLAELQSAPAAGAAARPVLSVTEPTVLPAMAANPPGGAQPGAQNRFRILFRPKEGFFSSGNDPLRLLRLLETMGEFKGAADLSRLPDIEAFNPESCYLAWEMELVTDSGREQILEVFDWVMDDCDLTVEPAPGSAPGTSAAAEEAPQVVMPEPTYGRRRDDYTPAEEETRFGRRRDDGKEPGGQRAASLHVSTEKVDDLVNLVGELVITQTTLRQIVENFDLSRLPRLEATASQLARNTRDLQESVMAIRMLPVSFAFSRFGRLVRDVSLQLGKQVMLEISGEQSELDKTVIEKLIDPLTHLVRNALDHGIETPEERRACGKPEMATLSLHAEHKGGNIVIEVSDDGRGIEYEKVRAKASQLGLVAQGEEISQERLDEMLFMPGFSTAAAVSDLSGRGVGLDVVRRNIVGLGGSLEVSSVAGRGASFIVRLPLTLAIVDGMSVSAGGETYIVPLLFIIESIQPSPDAVKTVSGKGQVVEVRGEYLPILELNRLFCLTSEVPDHQGVLVLLEAEGKKIALMVDALLGQDQVVIKSLEANYRKVRHIAGATILGDGRVALILDVNSLVRMATF